MSHISDIFKLVSFIGNWRHERISLRKSMFPGGVIGQKLLQGEMSASLKSVSDTGAFPSSSRICPRVYIDHVAFHLIPPTDLRGSQGFGFVCDFSDVHCTS